MREENARLQGKRWEPHRVCGVTRTRTFVWGFNRLPSVSPPSWLFASAIQKLFWLFNLIKFFLSRVHTKFAKKVH